MSDDHITTTTTDSEEPVITYAEERVPNTGGVPVRQQLMLVAVVLFLVFGTTLTTRLLTDSSAPEPTVPSTIPYPTTDQQSDEPMDVQPFEAVDIVAQAAYVWDVRQQRALFKKQEGTALPLASVTKLMTALVAHEVLAEDEAVPIDTVAIKQDGDSGFIDGETFSRQTLSDLVLLSSSNDGAYALAHLAGDELNSGGTNSFIQAMNVRAEELGLHETTFYNPTGLDISNNQAGAYGSAKDMAFLMEYILTHNPGILESTREPSTRVYSSDGIYHDADNTNYYIDEIPGLLGSKTGYTDLAGGNLVIAYDAGLDRPIIISVLGSTQSNRFTDVLALVEATNQYLSQ